MSAGDRIEQLEKRLGRHRLPGPPPVDPAIFQSAFSDPPQE